MGEVLNNINYGSVYVKVSMIFEKYYNEIK